MDRRQLLTGLSAAAFVPISARAQAEAAHTFPPEWHEHEAIWMGWTDSVTASDAHTTLRLEMIEALAPHVPVKMLVTGDDVAAHIRKLMDKRRIPAEAVIFVKQPTVDVWTRDSGPLFVSDGKTLQLADFKWGNYGFPWPHTGPMSMERKNLDQEVAAQFGYKKRRSEVVAEGGGIDVNSSCMVSYMDAALHRNPGFTLAEIEDAFKRLYGKKKVIWLNRAPVSDRVFAGPKVANFFGWGANGHVDEYVRFTDENTVLVAQVSEEEREMNALYRLDHEILEENRRQLELATDPWGRPFEVIPMPMPDVTTMMETRTLTEEDFRVGAFGAPMHSVYRDFKPGDEIHWLPAMSYLNFLVTNDVVLTAKYGKEGRADHLRKTDEQAAEILKERFPGRKIIGIDPMAANWNGGGMHCITQQEPKLKG
ncbi:hypothetical protein HK107_14920 [Parvularcula sp. ZS-1/3]|uniref:Agmatine deiminase family protein n=1 Tax=Parvularcula mediterranea TaxID=2732508 RepID=A0A7Y3RQP5_9PROT|nr:agmatine deiminase family protein [Parvularcula mediterranea]NNU17622.1 hypothetical protein [Parvularcula mediterranea]